MAYGTKYTSSFYNNNGGAITVTYAQDGYVGSSSEIILAADPIVAHVGAEDDDVFFPIRATTLTIRMMGTTRGQFEDFFTSDNREWKVTVSIEGTAEYIGYILPDQYAEPYCDDVYVSEIQVSDGLMDLKSIDYLDSGARYSGLASALEIIDNCLTLADVGNFYIYDGLATYEDAMDTGATDSPLPQVQILQELFYDEDTDTPWNCYDVLSEILKSFGAVIQQVRTPSAGWWIFEPHLMKADTLAMQKYLGTSYVDTVGYTTYKTIGSESCFVNADTILSFKENIGKSVITFDRGIRKNYCRDGYFNLWDGGSLVYWSKNSSPSITDIDGGVQIDYVAAVDDTAIYITIGVFEYIKDFRISFIYRPIYTDITNLWFKLVASNDSGTKYWNGTAWSAVEAREDITELSNAYYEYDTTYPDTGLTGANLTFTMYLEAPVAGMAPASCVVEYYNVQVSSDFSSNIYDNYYLSDIVDYEYTTNTNVKRNFEVSTKLGDIEKYQSVLNGGYYDLSNNRTTSWSLKNEVYSSDLQTLLARKTALQRRGIVRTWEGSILNLSSYAYYNPLCLRDTNFTDEYDEVVSMFPVYTEYHMESDELRGLWVEIKEHMLIT